MKRMRGGERWKKESLKRREGRVELVAETAIVVRRVPPNKSRTLCRMESRRTGGETARGTGDGEVWRRGGGLAHNRPPSIHCFQRYFKTFYDIIIIFCVQLARKHGAGGRESRHNDVVEELKNAFELAERSSPGITNR